VANEYAHVSTWLYLYGERRRIAHSGIKTMNPQPMYDLLNNLESKISNQEFTFKSATEEALVKAAIRRHREHFFVTVLGTTRHRKTRLIVT